MVCETWLWQRAGVQVVSAMSFLPMCVDLLGLPLLLRLLASLAKARRAGNNSNKALEHEKKVCPVAFFLSAMPESRGLRGGGAAGAMVGLLSIVGSNEEGQNSDLHRASRAFRGRRHNRT